MSELLDQPRASQRAPSPSHAHVRAHTAAPRGGGKWVEAAATEFGALSALMADEMSARVTPGFASGSSRAIATAETAFMLAIDDDESQTDHADQHPIPVMVMAVPAARPLAPIACQTDSTAPSTPRRPAPAINAEAVRAVLSQPTAALLPAAPRAASLPLVALTPAPRAKSFAPPPKARARSFVGRLGVPVVPPPTTTAPMSTSHRMVVVTHTARNRGLNMTAAILSGLAAAMAVMAVIVSV